MRLFDYSGNIDYDTEVFPDCCRDSGEMFIFCRTHEVSLLRSVFGFDASTVLDNADLDESVRYTNLDRYDFVSLVHIEMAEDNFIHREINLYVSARYLVLVMPEHASARLREMERKLLIAARGMRERSGRLCWMYYLLFHYLLADFSDMLERLEDRMQALSEEIVLNADTTQFAHINALRNMAYSAKKQLRALSYIGDQILLDENNLIGKSHRRYFQNVSTRLKKLYDFAESLYNLNGEMLYTYDSRLTMKTNETVNKLAALTLFFGPLTVITGIYGMNFDFMPELHLKYGYFFVLAGMAAVSAILLVILKKKKWL